MDGRSIGLHRSQKFADAGIVLALVVAATLSWAPRMRGPIDLRWDAAVYYLLGTSIADDFSYRILSEPGVIEATIYPPLLPLLVAAHQWLLGTNDPVLVGGWLRLTFWVLLTAYLAGSYIFLRTRLPVVQAAVAVTLCTLSWYPHWLSDRCYSDLPFAVAAIAFFVFGGRGGRHDAGAGACAVAGYLLRSAGVALLVAWVAEQLIAREWKRAVLRLMIAAVPVLAWQGHIYAVEHRDAYVQPAYPYQRAAYNVYNVSYRVNATFRDHRHPHLGHATTIERVRQFVRNAALLPEAAGGAVSVRRAGWNMMMRWIKATQGLRHMVPWVAIPLIMGFLGALVIIGLLRQVYEGYVVVPLSLATYAGTLCILPTSYMYELPRYVTVFAPALVLALMQGVTVTRPTLPARLRTIGPALLFGFVIAAQIVVLAELYVNDSREVEYHDWRGHRVSYRLFTYDERSIQQDRAIAWLNRHARPDAIVVSSSPQWIYLRTGLRAIMPPMESDPREVRRLLDSVPVTYVMIEHGSFTGDYAAPALRRAPGDWKRVMWDPASPFEMYERRVQ